MKRAEIRFYAELNDFLPPEKKFRTITIDFDVETTVKDLIEGLGVPHVEVDLILLDGESVDFNCKIKDGCRIAVFPVFESFDIGHLTKVRPKPLRDPRFVLDVHLGRLASLLRLLGFDSVFQNNLDDETLANISANQGRILLTRDRGLLKRSMVSRGYCVREVDPEKQLREVVTRFQLSTSARPFTRCPKCNHALREAQSYEIMEKVPAKIMERHQVFRYCDGCDSVYWPGRHVDKLMKLFEELGCVYRLW